MLLLREYLVLFNLACSEKYCIKEPPLSFPQTLQEKDKLELKAKVTGSPVPEVKWFKDDKEIVATLKNKISKTKDGVHTLTVSSVAHKTGSGVYKAVATNKAGKAEHKATIEVTGRLS